MSFWGYALVHHVFPRLQHRLGRFSIESLDRLDKKVCKFTRSLLKLPNDTTLGFINGASRDVGGLGIPAFKTLVPHLAVSRLNSLCHIDEPDVSAVTETEQFRSPCEAVERCMTTPLHTKYEERLFWRCRLYQSLDGKGQNQPLFERAQTWVNDGSKQRGARYIGAIHIRGSVVNAPVKLSRGNRGGQEIMCLKPACTGWPVSLAHMV